MTNYGTNGSFSYLAMFRPPVREMCVDVLVELWEHSKNQSSKHVKTKLTGADPEPGSQHQKLVQKWRPSALAKKIENGQEEGSGDGEEQEDAKMENGENGA